MTQSTTKIQGKFYPLQHEEWLRACRELTPAQRDVLYYLRTLDPYSTGLEISPARIAKDLSSEEKPVHRSTVGRALKVLDDKGFIDMELLKVKVNILTKGLHCCLETTSCTEATSCDEATVLPTGNLGDRDATSAIATQQARSLRNKHEPEASSDEDSSIPKINKTYLDFLDSLLENEKENFLNFGKKKAAELKNPPVQLPLKWIEKNFDELRSQWEKSQGRTDAVQAQKWENHPQREEWLDKIRQLGPVGFQAEDMPNQKLRREFYMWAETNKLIWGEMES
ncbi:hypothetical protein BV378_20385 [Nostoc sp. RF31YmG]|jgi:Fe2+ or Zn2+ uptake regulation protein|nr:hypothetical protein BV378_20385 [Nostoc sp. RF31YmG]